MTTAKTPRALFPDSPTMTAWKLRNPKPLHVERCPKPGCRRVLLEIFDAPDEFVVVFYRNSPDRLANLKPLEEEGGTREWGHGLGQVKKFDGGLARIAGEGGDRGTVVGLIDGWHDIVEPTCRDHGSAGKFSRIELTSAARVAARERR